MIREKVRINICRAPLTCAAPRIGLVWSIEYFDGNGDAATSRYQLGHDTMDCGIVDKVRTQDL